MARRLYLAFLGVLLVVVAVTMTINFLFGRPLAAHPAPRLAGHVAHVLDGADDLQRAVEEAHDTLGVDITVIDRAGGVVAVAGLPIRARPPPSFHGAQWIEFPGVAGAQLRIRSGLIVLVQGSARRFLIRPLLLILAVLLVSFALVYPLSRSITRPLEKLTRAVRAYGVGDLAQRSGLGDLRDEVGQLARSFDEMADRIQAARKAEKELLANVSHELRTPLQRMKVAMELMDTPDEALRRRLTSLGEEVDELERLVGDILTATRLDLSALPLHKTSVPVAAVLEKTRQRMPDVPVTLMADPSLVVEADEALFSRAMDNLLDNARKYAGGAAVEVSARREGAEAVIAVRDHGPGFPPGDLDHVFDPFFRGETARGRASGFGLGLALARRVAEAHGGSARAQNADGGGARIEIRLPA